jgi:hypothetical protein
MWIGPRTSGVSWGGPPQNLWITVNEPMKLFLCLGASGTIKLLSRLR